MAIWFERTVFFSRFYTLLHTTSLTRIINGLMNIVTVVLFVCCCNIQLSTVIILSCVGILELYKISF